MFAVTGLTTCPCPEICEQFLRDRLTGTRIEVRCVPKPQQVDDYVHGTFPSHIFVNLWRLADPEGAMRADEKRACESHFEEAYQRRMAGGGAPCGKDDWLMVEWTMSPLIVFVGRDGTPHPIGGKQSLRRLMAMYNAETRVFTRTEP